MPHDIHSFFSTVQNCCGLSIHLRQGDDHVVTLIDLDQVGDALRAGEWLAREVLSAAEQAYFKRFNHLKRRKEWLGGRIAAKAGLLFFSEPEKSDVRQLTILPNKYGRPTAEGSSGGQENLSISISHSGRYAVALAASGDTCGIDLQKISPKLASLTDHFASDKELVLLACQSTDEEQDTWLTMLWTVKETLKKSMLHDKSVIFSETETERITAVRKYIYRFICSVRGYPQSVTVYTLPPYILSISLPDRHA
jgi:phosphopantetheinyl transferase (holo-ACP synthase)